MANMDLKEFWKEIPKLPLTALVFYLFIVLLWNLQVIPSPSEIIIFLESLYIEYGKLGLFIAAFLEGIVYLGLYFPGSFIIALVIFVSEGSFNSILSIAFIVTLAWTITCIIDYLLGRLIPFKRKVVSNSKKLSKGFIFSFFHQNILAFYFFNEGIEKKNPWKLLIVFPIMFIWVFFLTSVFSLLRNSLRQAVESQFTLLALILIWILVAFIFERRRKKNEF